MPTSIGTLPVVALDYTRRGPGLHVGLAKLKALLDAPGGRDGHLLVTVTVTGAAVPVVMACSDLYVLGFRCGGSWFRFDDADWPFPEDASRLGFDGRYASLGGLVGTLTTGAIDGIAKLASLAHRAQWREALRTLLVVVPECARLILVRMEVLGLLNGIVPAVSLASLAGDIQNWDRASKGEDMSREVAPNVRVGFRDPTIIKR